MTDHKIVLVRAALFLASAAIMVSVIVAGASRAFGHSWYPWECCSDKDCEPIAGDVDETATGYTLPDGTTVAYTDPVIKISADAKFHWCRNLNNGKLICLFVPARGV